MARSEDALRAPARVVAHLVEAGSGPVLELARLGRDSLLAALIATVHGLVVGQVGDREDGEGPQGHEITRRLLDGNGRLTRGEVADQAGLPLDQAQRLWRAVGFPEVADDDKVFTSADVEALRDVHGLVRSGAVDVDGIVALARPMGQLLSRLAVAHTSLVADVLGTRLAQAQATGEVTGDPQLSTRVTAQAVEITRELLPALERTTVYVWRRHLASEAGRELVPSADPKAGATPHAVGFIDISGFTRLSRSLPETELDELLDGFEALVWNAVVDHSGRVVKTLGDEILFVTDSAPAAARIVLDVLDRVREVPDVPMVHAGLAYGPVLSRGGDVYGPVVNIASRVTSLARRDSVRVDHAMADALADCDEFDVRIRVPRRVRGYDQLRSYRLRRA